MTPQERIIIALDLPTLEEAETLVARLGEEAVWYKIGYQLLPLGGYAMARRLHSRGKKVFIDAKLLDIGSTVEKGVRSLAELGADYLTVHADPDTVKGAVEGRGGSDLCILAVTVLTSWGEEALRHHGIEGSVEDAVLRRAEMALEAGADGLIASGREAPLLREHFGDGPIIVTPGIRPSGAALGDQKRVLTPAEAVKSGATHLVIGRPISQAADPKAAFDGIVGELSA
ncbi:orotidine-5'-phosphate decarboxylase [Parvularcula maris]|uniref:Orotidine 5'-phosphate decarboxylase n=1 Tax=Parvularcula maris TaxID=2965077 RepID=A0A9X2RGI3_9PROT|nr:orotidine-5'-phosphate decarboxylase [Parvularcula maris]MCQ8183959.1 orotidine-5'-phosphate decarboxylase [Parvularcula maris]